MKTSRPVERGMDVKTSHTDRRINTTLGELIATISDLAFEYSDDTKEAYDIARVVLVEILKETSFKGEIINRPLFWN